jgi:hypothetical protein
MTPCFFKPSLEANGRPYNYSLHKTGKTAGGIGPGGSIRSSTLDIEVPRSKFAQRAHATALVIKILAIAFFMVVNRDFFHVRNDLKYVINFGLGIVTGFVLVYTMYSIINVKPIFRHARKFPEVQHHLKNNYSIGPHAFVSTTPFGILYHLMKGIL